MAGFMIIIQDTGILSRYSVDSNWIGSVNGNGRLCLGFSTTFFDQVFRIRL